MLETELLRTLAGGLQVDTPQVWPRPTVLAPERTERQTMAEPKGSRSGSEVDRECGECAPPMRLPLNSKRLKAGQLQQLVTVLDVPTGESADEVHQ